ncbi:transposable element Tcb1 transposase [Trichonephila clavipes]|nr:transposable element Tcb1 transposase [Trichonephila clavipes]
MFAASRQEENGVLGIPLRSLRPMPLCRLCQLAGDKSLRRHCCRASAADKGGRIIGQLECGRNQLEVSEELGIAQNVISRLWQRFQNDVNKQTEHSIRPVSSATGTTVSRQTVYRRLGHIGLYARRPVRFVPLTATHCRLRLTWSREHALWTPQQWSCVMFSDESRFSLPSDSRPTLI